MVLMLEPNSFKMAPWDLVCYSDSDYAGDPDTRRSVTGFVLFVRDVPVCWRSKAQMVVTLSSTEAEWYALSEVVKEVLFVVQLVESMEIQVQLPVIVRVDNVGAVFMAKNITTTGRIKHVDIRTLVGNVGDMLPRHVGVVESWVSHMSACRT